jgi:hypothetical protein
LVKPCAVLAGGFGTNRSSGLLEYAEAQKSEVFGPYICPLIVDLPVNVTLTPRLYRGGLCGFQISFEP